MSDHDRTGRSRPTPRSAGDAGDEFLAPQDDDLRYEGPIAFDDKDGDGDVAYADEGGGKVFLTAALIGAAVILLVGVALWLRRDASDTPRRAPGMESAAAEAPLPRVSQADESAAREAPAAGTSTPIGDRLPGASASTPATGSPAPAPAAPAPDFTQRAVPAAPVEPPPAVTHESATVTHEAAATTHETPAPEPAATETTPASKPARKVASAPVAEARPAQETRAEAPAEHAPAAGTSKIHRLVASGDLAAAAKAGALRAKKAKGYTLQVVYACKARTIKNAFGAVADSDLFLVPAKKADCYRLLWGTYASRSAASAAAAEVPAYFKNAGAPHPMALSEAIAR